MASPENKPANTLSLANVPLIYDNSRLQFGPDIAQACRAREKQVKRLSKELSDAAADSAETRTPFVIRVAAGT